MERLEYPNSVDNPKKPLSSATCSFIIKKKGTICKPEGGGVV